MGFNDGAICCGCLHSGRKIMPVDEYWHKQCFLQILSEIPVFEPETEPVSLCWECIAQLRKFTKFKSLVKNSYLAFKEHVKQSSNPQDILIIETKPKLTLQKIFEITLEHSTGDTEAFEVVLPEYYCNEVQDITDGEHSIAKNNLNETCVEKIEENVENIDDCNDDFVDPITDVEELKIVYVKAKKRKKKNSKNESKYTTMHLSREELLEERRLAMLEENYVNAIFKCERCILCFANGEDLKDHINLKHEMHSTKLKCDICECSFGTGVSYNYHSNKHTRRYQCFVCTERFNSKSGVLKHYGHSHGSPSIKWSTGDIIDNSAETECDKTDSTKQSDEIYPCEICNKTFLWKTSLRKHLEKHRIETGQKRKPYCEPCRVSFTNTANLQKHVKTSAKHQIRLKLCKLKETPSDQKSEQAQVERIKRAVMRARQLFPCAHCDKTFQWRGNLARHVHTHAARAKGDLVCKPCNRTFSSIATYKQHMAISKKHVSENDFKYMCNHCGKKFPNKTKLKDHINWEHLKSYVHTCTACQKKFKSRTSLYLHDQVVHKKDTVEHLCHHCGKPFPNQAKLKAHIRAGHSGGATFKCDVCSAKFNWASCLSRHVRRVHKKQNAE